MRRLLLTVGMLLMGMALVGGAAAALVPTSLLPLDQEVGTHTSAAGAVLGIGLMAAAVNPRGNVGWSSPSKRALTTCGAPRSTSARCFSGWPSACC
jgi:hypothetical protein